MIFDCVAKLQKINTIPHLQEAYNVDG